MKRDTIALVIKCIVDELNDFGMLAFLHSANITMGGKKPVKFDNMKFQCLLKAYTYFTTILVSMDNGAKKIVIEAPDNLILGAATLALRNTDKDDAHQLIAMLHLEMNIKKFETVTDWLEVLKTTSMDSLIDDINQSIALAVAASL